MVIDFNWVKGVKTHRKYFIYIKTKEYLKRGERQLLGIFRYAPVYCVVYRTDCKIEDEPLNCQYINYHSLVYCVV